MGCQKPCMCCNREEMNLPKVFTNLQSLITQGCDLEDCKLRIYDVIQRPVFQTIPLNQQHHRDELNDYQSLDREDEDAELTSECGSDTFQWNFSIEEHNIIAVASDSSFDSNSTEQQISEETRYLTNVRLLAEFLNSQGLSLIQPRTSDDLGDSMSIPIKMSLPILQACGLNNSYEDLCFDTMKPILFPVLYGLLSYKSAVNMDNLIVLVANSADIYHVEWDDKSWEDDVEDGLMTLTAYAKANDLLPQWLKAVATAGYDPEEVLLEDMRKRREFRLLHGAKSSSVEIGEALGEPGSQELRRRTVGRAEME
ncbi:hypothetical protein B0J13DRAFT_62290 [Dactylonectria estremocensis]|uniref:Uncharacterized protein n=1 Tax=Dactylonectria estremocensis TaxID=1079267 RepID=A0A9P9IZZ3_9HYPO|nr:hypothetical protein B0J13DRAFT_62290 [Dactylonectria estremocensis]